MTQHEEKHIRFEIKSEQIAMRVQNVVPEKISDADINKIVEAVVAELDNKGYQTEAQVMALINEALGAVENGTY